MKRLILVLVIVLFSGCVESKTENIYVSQVIDGDTFVLSNGDHIRLIGINTPETDEYYYGEAKQALASLLYNKQVQLRSDISSKDRYGRTLKYVYVDGIFVNQYMIENGYARVYVIEPNVKYRSDFNDAEIIAKRQNLGIWNNNI